MQRSRASRVGTLLGLLGAADHHADLTRRVVICACLAYRFDEQCIDDGAVRRQFDQRLDTHWHPRCGPGRILMGADAIGRLPRIGFSPPELLHERAAGLHPSDRPRVRCMGMEGLIALAVVVMAVEHRSRSTLGFTP